MCYVHLYVPCVYVCAWCLWAMCIWVYEFVSASVYISARRAERGALCVAPWRCCFVKLLYCIALLQGLESKGKCVHRHPQLLSNRDSLFLIKEAWMPTCFGIISLLGHKGPHRYVSFSSNQPLEGYILIFYSGNKFFWKNLTVKRKMNANWNSHNVWPTPLFSIDPSTNVTAPKCLRVLVGL